MLTIKLNDDDIVEWKDIFWPYWFIFIFLLVFNFRLFFSVMIGITLGFVIILFGKSY